MSLIMVGCKNAAKTPPPPQAQTDPDRPSTTAQNEDHTGTQEERPSNANPIKVLDDSVRGLTPQPIRDPSKKPTPNLQAKEDKERTLVENLLKKIEINGQKSDLVSAFKSAQLVITPEEAPGCKHKGCTEISFKDGKLLIRLSYSALGEFLKTFKGLIPETKGKAEDSEKNQSVDRTTGENKKTVFKTEEPVEKRDVQSKLLAFELPRPTMPANYIKHLSLEHPNDGEFENMRIMWNSLLESKNPLTDPAAEKFMKIFNQDLLSKDINKPGSSCLQPANKLESFLNESFNGYETPTPSYYPRNSQLTNAHWYFTAYLSGDPGPFSEWNQLQKTVAALGIYMASPYTDTEPFRLSFIEALNLQFVKGIPNSQQKVGTCAFSLGLNANFSAYSSGYFKAEQTIESFLRYRIYFLAQIIEEIANKQGYIETLPTRQWKNSMILTESEILPFLKSINRTAKVYFGYMNSAFRKNSLTQNTNAKTILPKLSKAQINFWKRLPGLTNTQDPNWIEFKKLLN
ncbi:MAG TPA: hypothetical protein PLU50_05665 [Pseudobdellovibrionaceae bacterium]|nr:hypothetical protein [Pseudobdellovibrionaceae bacterium]